MGSARRGGVDAGVEAERGWEERDGAAEYGDGEPGMGGGCEGVSLSGSVSLYVVHLADGPGMDGSQGWIASPFRVWICGLRISMTRLILYVGTRGVLLCLATPWHRGLLSL